MQANSEHSQNHDTVIPRWMNGRFSTLQCVVRVPSGHFPPGLAEFSRVYYCQDLRTLISPSVAVLRRYCSWFFIFAVKGMLERTLSKLPDEATVTICQTFHLEKNVLRVIWWFKTCALYVLLAE